MGFKKEALVSIVMPAYNCEDFIGITLDSVNRQRMTIASVFAVK